MLKTCLTYLLIGICLSAYSQTLDSPESVEYDEKNDRYFISNVGSSDILQMDDNGLSVFSNIVTSPHGLVIMNDVLYVADGNGRCRGLKLSDASLTMSVATGGGFLNGICADGDSMLYITDFSGGVIYWVNVNSQSSGIFANVLGTPNGIYYHGEENRLIYVQWGTNADIMRVSLSDSSVAPIRATNLGNIDGITRDCAGNWYVTAWTTQGLHMFDPNFSTDPVLVFGGLSNPADIDYNDAEDSIAIPNSSNNTVVFASLGNIKYDTVTRSIDQGDSILLGGAYQTTAGDYIDTFSAVNNCDSVVTTMLTVIQPPEGIRDLNVAAFQLFPNPSSGKVVITVNEESIVEIIGVDGRVVHRAVVQRSASINMTTGSYFVRLTNSKIDVTRKLVVF
ncbi:MAG: T9SS type A sorting domain-containing protein [Bacteroidetes bacterium]|nr:T9SS type A sorting domain-containing protein [Bacteroidota bacterium]